MDISGSLDWGPGVVGRIWPTSASSSLAVPFSSSFKASYGEGYSANLCRVSVPLLGSGGRGVLPLISPLSKRESSAWS
jgi:hypothetical protein